MCVCVCRYIISFVRNFWNILMCVYGHPSSSFARHGWFHPYDDRKYVKAVEIYSERQADWRESNENEKVFFFLISRSIWLSMSSPETRYPASGSGGGRDSPPIVTPHYGSSLPKASDDIENARKTRCVTGVRFIMSIHGILNVVIFVSKKRSSILVDSVIWMR